MNPDQMDYEMDGQGGRMLPRPQDPGCVEQHRPFNPNTAGSSNMSQQHPPPGFGTMGAGFNYWNHPDPSMHQTIHADSGRGAALAPNHPWMQQYLRHGTATGLFAPPVASSPESPASNANNSAVDTSQTTFSMMYGHGSYESSHSFALGPNQYMPANASNLPRLPPLDLGNYPARYLPHPQRLDYGSAADRVMVGGHHRLRDSHSSIPVPRTVASTNRPAAPRDEPLNTHGSRAAMNDTSDTEEDTDEAEEHDEDAALEAYISDARRNYIPASLPNDPERLRAIAREQRRRQIRMAQSRDMKLVASQACLDSLIEVDIATLDKADIMCVICYTDFGVESADGLIESPVRLPTCNHLFGENCIRHWLKDSDSCPFCRHKLPSEPKQRKIRREGYREYRMRLGLSGDHGGGLGPEGRLYASYASGVPDHLVDGGHLTSAEHELLLNSYRQRSREIEAIFGNGPPRFSATDGNRRVSDAIRREEIALEGVGVRNGSTAPVDRSEQRRRARHRAASRSAASPNSYSPHSTRWSSQGLQPSSPPTSQTQQRDRGSALDDMDGHHGPRSITPHPTALESPPSLSMNASPSASTSASASASRLNPAVPEWNMNRGAPLSQIMDAGQGMTRNNPFDATVLHHRRTAPQHYLTQQSYMNPYYYPQPGARLPSTGSEYLAAEARHDRMARDESIHASGLTIAEQAFLQNGRHMALDNGHPGTLGSIDGFDFRQVGAGQETIHGMAADDSDIPSSPVNSVEVWPAAARNNAGV